MLPDDSQLPLPWKRARLLPHSGKRQGHSILGRDSEIWGSWLERSMELDPSSSTVTLNSDPSHIFQRASANHQSLPQTCQLPPQPPTAGEIMQAFTLSSSILRQHGSPGTVSQVCSSMEFCSGTPAWEAVIKPHALVTSKGPDSERERDFSEATQLVGGRTQASHWSISLQGSLRRLTVYL